MCSQCKLLFLMVSHYNSTSQICAGAHRIVEFLKCQFAVNKVTQDLQKIMQETWRLLCCHTCSIYLHCVVELVVVFLWSVKYQFGIQVCLMLSHLKWRGACEKTFFVYVGVFMLNEQLKLISGRKNSYFKCNIRLKQHKTCSVKQNLKFHLFLWKSVPHTCMWVRLKSQLQHPEFLFVL